MNERAINSNILTYDKSWYHTYSGSSQTQSTKIISPAMTANRQPPILSNTTGIRATASETSRRYTGTVILWAWAPWGLEDCCSPRWTWRITTWDFLCWWVPLGYIWSTLLPDLALTSHLGLGRLGWGHIAGDIIGPWLRLLLSWVWAWIHWCHNVHFNGLLGHVISSAVGCSGGV